MSSYSSWQEKSDPENLENVEVGKDLVGVRVWKQMPSTSPYPAEQYQVWKQDSLVSREVVSWKQEQKSGSPSSTCTWKQEPSVKQNQNEKDSGNVRAPMHYYLRKGYKYIQKKLELMESSIQELAELRTNILVWGSSMSSSMKPLFSLDSITLRTREGS